MLLVWLCLAACQKTSSPKSHTSSSPQSDSRMLRLALTPTLDCLPFYYIANTGLADSLALPIELHTFQSQMDVDTALMGSVFDGGVGDVGRKEQQPLRMRKLSQRLLLPTQWSLVAHADLRMPHLSKISTRTVAVARWTADEKILFHLADSLRVPRKKIYCPQINSFSTRLKMLENKQIDATLLPEPFATLAKHWGHQVKYNTQRLAYQRAFYLKTPTPHNKAKQEQYQRLQRAYNEAVRQINRGTPKTDSVLIEHYGLTPEVLSKLRLPHYNLMP